MVIPEQQMEGVLLPLSRDADLRGVLTKKEEEVTLFARNIRFKPQASDRSAVIYLSVDGYQHAKVFEVDFTDVATTGKPREKGSTIASWRILTIRKAKRFPCAWK